jgi:hypothetical protein
MTQILSLWDSSGYVSINSLLDLFVYVFNSGYTPCPDSSDNTCRATCFGA